MKALEKTTVLIVFIVIQILDVPSWAIDIHPIQVKYGFNFQETVQDYQHVIETTKQSPKDLRCTYHIGSLHHIPAIDSKIDDSLFLWIDLEDDKDFSGSKTTTKVVKHPLKKTACTYPTKITTHGSSLFLLDSSFLL